MVAAGSDGRGAFYALQSWRGADPGWTNDYGPVMPANAVILKAISVVKKRG